MALPHYKEVPDAWKSGPPHFGPFTQAPPEYGGEWYYVGPFQQEPWKPVVPVTQAVDAAFLDIFGPKPRHRLLVPEWEQNRRYFKGVGIPPGFTQAQIEDVTERSVAWGLGRPRIFEGRYGWSARFPDSQIPDYEAANAIGFLMSPDVVFANYQTQLLMDGIVPEKIHPFVPPQLLPEKEKPKNP